MEMLKIVTKEKKVKDDKGNEKTLTFQNIYLFGVCVRPVAEAERLKLYYSVKGYINAQEHKE